MTLRRKRLQYLPEFAEQAEKLCRLGATNQQIADFWSTAGSTIDKWIKTRPDFAEAVRRGRQEADANVADSLYRRALGWTNPNAVKIFMPAGAEEPVYAPYVEHVAPDTTACIFWLKNRRPDVWRDAHRHELTGKDGNYLAIPDVELARRLAFVLAQADKSVGESAAPSPGDAPISPSDGQVH
jgi:hypothetical protein